MIINYRAYTTLFYKTQVFLSNLFIKKRLLKRRRVLELNVNFRIIFLEIKFNKKINLAPKHISEGYFRPRNIGG